MKGADLSEANVTGAIFLGAKGITPEQLKRASHYDSAILESEFGKSQGFTPLDLSDRDFSKFDFRYTSLAGRSLERVKLVAANLNGADLSKANLKGAFLFNASLRGADLTDANLDGANLTSVNQPVPEELESKASMGTVMPSPQGTIGRPPSLPNRGEPTGGKRTNFRGSSLRGAILSFADLQEADFSYADLAGASFSSTDLRNAVFTGANLTNAKFELCQNLTDAQIKAGTNWKQASFSLEVAVKLGLKDASDLPPASGGGMWAPSKGFPSGGMYVPQSAMPAKAPTAPTAPPPDDAVPIAPSPRVTPPQPSRPPELD